MLQLIVKLREFLAMTGLSLTSLMAVLKLIADIGLPPALKDKEAFKTWVKKVAAAIAQVAAMTANTADDQLASLLAKIVDNQTAWEIFYGIIEKLMPAEDGVFKGVVSDEDLDFAAQQVSDALSEDSPEMQGLSPAFILAAFKIISTLVALFKS